MFLFRYLRYYYYNIYYSIVNVCRRLKGEDTTVRPYKEFQKCLSPKVLDRSNKEYNEIMKWIGRTDEKQH